jgi:hypothetical protein
MRMFPFLSVHGNEDLKEKNSVENSASIPTPLVEQVLLRPPSSYLFVVAGMRLYHLCHVYDSFRIAPLSFKPLAGSEQDTVCP